MIWRLMRLKVGCAMKRMMLCVLCMLLFGGCGILRQRAYVVVEPHQEEYQKSPDETMTVGSYGGLKNAIASLVEDGVKDGVIRAESYSGNLDEDLSQAVREVAQMSPMGVFAVEHMTYDYSRIVSYYEIHLNITFRRTAEEIASVVYVTDMAAVSDKLLQAMENYEPRLLLRVGDYEYLDIDDETAELYEAHPEFALELPETAVEMYPDSGTQRILEITFSYHRDQAALLTFRDRLQQCMDEIVRIYGSAHLDMTNAKRIYKRLGRDAEVLESGSDTNNSFSDGAYGVLLDRSATSYGFARTYLSLLESCGIEGELIPGRKNGVTHYWCLVQLDGAYYYVDPSYSTQDVNAAFFLLGSEELLAFGYESYRMASFPEVVLPEYLKPATAGNIQ